MFHTDGIMKILKRPLLSVLSVFGYVALKISSLESERDINSRKIIKLEYDLSMTASRLEAEQKAREEEHVNFEDERAAHQRTSEELAALKSQSKFIHEQDKSSAVLETARKNYLNSVDEIERNKLPQLSSWWQYYSCNSYSSL